MKYVDNLFELPDIAYFLLWVSELQHALNYLFILFLEDVTPCLS